MIIAPHNFNTQSSTQSNPFNLDFIAWGTEFIRKTEMETYNVTSRK